MPDEKLKDTNNSNAIVELDDREVEKVVGGASTTMMPNEGESTSVIINGQEYQRYDPLDEDLEDGSSSFEIPF